MKSYLVWFFGIVLFTLALIGISKQMTEVEGEIRAALDIGSGATNLKVARVNPETNKIISQIFEKSIPVPYQKHLEQSSNNTFDQPVMEQGIQSIKALKEIANSYHAKKVVAVATAAFRQASNASNFAQEIEKQTGVQVRIIEQDEEGIMAFRGALAISSAQPEQTIVWDIGGGSMQLTTLTESDTYLVEKGKTASIPFKNAIIQQIKHKSLTLEHSPNPMSAEQMDTALQYAGSLALETDPYILEKIQNPSTKMIAVGSLFNYGIRPLVHNKQNVKQTELEKAIYSMVGKTDAELSGGALAEVAVSNPLLVLGYMKTLQIPEVEVLQVNNADGALTYPPYWE
jgi:exopolyphosphatase/guanosine-5'-triphosphate,3'-diphosphate pyrophosphatase